MAVKTDTSTQAVSLYEVKEFRRVTVAPSAHARALFWLRSELRKRHVEATQPSSYRSMLFKRADRINRVLTATALEYPASVGNQRLLWKVASQDAGEKRVEV